MNNFQTGITASNHDITHKMHNGKCLDCQVFTDGANPPNITGGNTRYDAFGNKNKSKFLYKEYELLDKKHMKKQIIINPNLEERKNEGYYWMKFYCENCGCPNGLYKGAVDVMIPQSEKSNYVLTCPNCKNETLKK